MKYFRCVVAVLCLAAYVCGATLSDQEFNDYILKFNKHYSQDEMEMRRQILADAKDKIAELNSISKATYGWTKFSDRTESELKAFKGYRKSPVRAEAPVFDGSKVSAIPTSFDWRTKGAVTPVKNQGQCGSCWAFSTTEGVESAWFLAKNQLLQLSPQQIVDCDDNDSGCGGGDLPTAFGYVQQNGLEPASDYPYVAYNQDCSYNSQDVVAHISGFQWATQNANETQMQAATIAHGPLSICVATGGWNYYNGGVMSSGCGEDVDHCVQIVGFDQTSDGTPYWIVRNSWGTDWGLNGYIWIQRNEDECEIADEAAYATVN